MLIETLLTQPTSNIVHAIAQFTSTVAYLHCEFLEYVADLGSLLNLLFTDSTVLDWQPVCGLLLACGCCWSNVFAISQF